MTASNPPSALRNQIYDAAVDAWLAAHGPENSRRPGMDPTIPWAPITRPIFTTTPHALVLSPRSAAYHGLHAAAQIATINNSYLAMKVDLVSPPLGHLCRQIMDEFRSVQRGRLDPFVHWAEMDEFMSIFYPSKDPAVVAAYNGRPITISFPDDDPQRVDIFPVLNLLARAPMVQCQAVWAWHLTVLPTSQPHEDQIFDSLFAPTNSLSAYMSFPNAHPIEKVMFRAHQSNFQYHRATVEIWFSPPPAGNHDLDWVDGKNWIWPEADPLAGTNVRPTKERRKRQSIWNFLNDAGLYVDEIEAGWHVRLGIVGRHSRGGLGISGYDI